MAAAPDEKGGAGEGHPLQQPPEPVDLARARRMGDGTRTQEEKALEQSMVEHVQEAAGKAQHRHDGRAVADAQQTDAQAEADDPDVLHAVVGEQSLDVVLREGEKHADHPGHRADARQGPAPPGRWRAERNVSTRTMP